MRKQRVKALLPFVMSAVLLAACQKAPEASDDDEMLRAKGALEDAVTEIVNEKEEEADGARESRETERVCEVLGDGENCMKIEAEIAAVPDALPLLTMQADGRLDEEALLGFLEPEGEVKDFTEELLAEEEEERQRAAKIDEKLGEGSSIVEMPGAGDKSRLALTDGNREAVLVGKTGGSFVDASLKETCAAISKESEKELDVKGGEGDAAFSLADAKELLLKKLSFLGIGDICLEKAYAYGTDEVVFYEMQFVPVVGGLPLAYCFGQQDAKNVYPQGMAWVCAGGVAEVGLWDCCMEQTAETENKKILGWEKVREVLGTYLSDKSLECRADVPFSTAELVYYAQLKEGKLELTPAWSIHTELEAYVDHVAQNEGGGFVWNIYIDAVTGKLLRVQT